MMKVLLAAKNGDEITCHIFMIMLMIEVLESLKNHWDFRCTRLNDGLPNEMKNAGSVQFMYIMKKLLTGSNRRGCKGTNKIIVKSKI